MTRKLVKLGSVCDLKNGFAFKSKLFKEKGLPILRISNIQNERIDTRRPVYFDAKDYKIDFRKYEVNYGDLLIAMSGATTGKIGFNVSETTFYLNQRVGKLVPGKNLNKKYLYYFLSTKIKENLEISKGAAQPNLSSEQIKNIEIFLPSLSEQQRIVAKLDAVFVKINKTIKATEKGIGLAKINLNNIIDAKTTFRQSWKKYKISDLGLVQTGNTPKTSNKKNYGDDIPFVKPPNFRKNGTIEVIKDGLSKEGAKFSRKANANTIMMVCIGATIGKVAINYEDVCFNQQINSLTPIKEYDAELIYWQMRGNRFQAEVQRKAGQATLPIISKSKWQNIDIFLPESLNEQIDIRTKLRKFSDCIDSYSKIKSQKLIELNKLKLSILIKELKPREAA